MFFLFMYPGRLYCFPAAARVRLNGATLSRGHSILNRLALSALYRAPIADRGAPGARRSSLSAEGERGHVTMLGCYNI